MHAEWGRLCRAQTADALNAARTSGGRIIAVGTTALRLLESAADENRHPSPVLRRDFDLHRAGLSLPRGRRAGHEFSSAALDVVHAGLGFCRARSDEASLCACDRARISLLFLRRRVSFVAMSEGFSFRVSASDGMRAHRRNFNAARKYPHAGFHAGRHRRHGESDVCRSGACARQRRRARQYLSSYAAPGSRARRRTGRPAQIHAMAASDPHRLRRLPGDVAREVAQAR